MQPDLMTDSYQARALWHHGVFETRLPYLIVTPLLSLALGSGRMVSGPNLSSSSKESQPLEVPRFFIFFVANLKSVTVQIGRGEDETNKTAGSNYGFTRR